MNRRLMFLLLIVLVSLTGCAQPTPTAEPTPTLVPTPAATPTPAIPTFSKDADLTIDLVSEITGAGEVAFAPGSKDGFVSVTINGELPVESMEKVCWFCFDTIRIAAGMEIPAEVFTILELPKDTIIQGGSLSQYFKLEKVNGVNVIKEPHEVEKIGFEATAFEYQLPSDSKSLICAGDSGVVLKKDGASFRLVEGEATLEK